MPGNSYYKKNLNVEEYVDQSLKNILDINVKIVEKDNIDIGKLKQLKLLFINELENICLGAGLISSKKRKFNFEEMSKTEKDLIEAVEKYYKATTSVRGGALNNMVFALIREAVEGGYKNKITNAKLLLNEESKKEGKPADWAEIQLANYKIQLILREIKNKNPETIEMGVE